MNRGCWLHMPSFLLSLQTAGLNDPACCRPDGHPLAAVSALRTARFFQELQMEKSERAFIWATEKAVGDVKEEDSGNIISNRSHFYSYSAD